MRDFTHIAYLGGPPVLCIVNPAHPAKDYKEFLAWAKASPKPIDYISPGTGTQGNLFAEGLARREGFKLVHIPHKGAGPALIDLIAGHVPFGSVTFSSAAELIRAGKVRPLAVSAEKRLANFPDIPTFRELGYDDLVTATWFGFSGPAKLPPEIVAGARPRDHEQHPAPAGGAEAHGAGRDRDPADDARRVHELPRRRGGALGAAGERAQRAGQVN